MLLPWVAVISGFYVFHSYWLSFVLYGFCCCLIPVLLLGNPQATPLKLPVSQKHMFVLAAILAVLITMLWPYLEDSFVSPDLITDSLSGIKLLSKLDFWLLAIYMVVINPVLEEFFWRGYIYEQFKKLMPQVLALVLSSFFFGLWHYVIIQHVFTPFWHIPLTLLVMLAGAVFARLYDKYGIMDAIIAHGLIADLPCMLILYQIMAKSMWVS